MALTLGLDVGPNSIGWALVDDAKQRIIDLGVRVFPEGMAKFDTKKEESRNENRRKARGMRRQIMRRARRKRELRDALIAVGLFPADEALQNELFNQNPYELRAKALDERLSLHQIGRVLLHLNQRRGFLSNRKKDRADKEVKGMLEEISTLAREIDECGARTLGEYLFQKGRSLDHSRRVEDDQIRNRHTRRAMLEEEFEKIYDAQAQHYSDILTQELRYGFRGKVAFPIQPGPRSAGKTTLEAFGLHGLIFFQRRMYWPKSVIGLCELEPKEKRCHRFDRHAQRFRLLQEINNLRYVDPASRAESRLSDQQRAALLAFLAVREKTTFDEIRRKLGLLETVKFNLERGGRSSLKGMVVDSLMAKAVGKEWHAQPEGEKDAIVRLLLENEFEDKAIAGQLVNDFGFSAEQAGKAVEVDFPAGYGSLSLKAIDKLLPHLERGLPYQSASDPEQSALHAAGYLRRDELQRRLFDRLPNPARVRPEDCRIGDIPNPVVKRTLVELRRVVNAILNEYGKPEAVHVEMARSAQMGPKARSEYNARIRLRETQRDRAAEEIRSYSQKDPSIGVRVNRESILRFQLWEEQLHECVYCQQPISQAQLFGGEVDVDHILPYSRCLDDSQANKVVVHRRCNVDKGQRTPYEWVGGSDPGRFETICQHAAALLAQGRMSYGKYRKFLQKELDLEDFIARQLSDTGYIARATAEYLRLLFKEPHHVLGLKGQHTAELRHQWGLNSILHHVETDRKNRDDHRHHAIDAVVVALTDRSRLQSLSNCTKEVEWADPESGEKLHRRIYCGPQLAEPWKSFRRDLETAIAKVSVSHRAERKVAGALHDDSFYGPTSEPNIFVKRKPIEALSLNEVSLIRDDRIRNIVIARLAEHGINVGRGAKVDAKKLKTALCNPDNPLLLPPSKRRLREDPNARGIPIRKVRIRRKEESIQVIRKDRPNEAYVKPDATHHLCLFEWDIAGKQRRAAVFVTQLEAIERVKNGQPVIQRKPPEGHPTIPPHARFVFSLSGGEMVLARVKGQDRLLVYKTAAATTGQMRFAHHTDARKGKEFEMYRFTPNTLHARKVVVDPIGRIRRAND